MKNHISFFKSIFLALTAFFTGSGYTAEPPPASQVLYPAGSQQSFKGPQEYFTGDVQVDLLFPANETSHFSGAYVTFQPAARTNWHLHPAGQHMLVTSGTALTGTRDGKIIEFNRGETVWCPPDIDHWHGASAHAPMTHLVITGSRDGENVIWKEKVSDAQYHGEKAKAASAQGSVEALTSTRRGLVAVSAYTANGDLEALKGAMHAALDAGLSINQVKEIPIHLYAYAGFPRALNSLATLMQVVEERKARGIEDEIGAEATRMPADQSLEIGRAVQTELAGRPVSGTLFDFAPAANELLQSHLFGDLFGRGILDYQEREIVTLSALASMTGVEPQLQAHMRIAANAGLSEQQIAAVAAVLARDVGAQQGSNASQALEAFVAERAE